MKVQGKYIPGDYYLTCQACGSKMRRSESRIDWMNRVVCDFCFDERHPNDTYKQRPDRQTVPVSSPEKTDVFVTSLEQMANKANL